MADFKLRYPVIPYAVNQLFGEDKKTYSRFGLQGHNGLDLRCYHGQPVYAAHDGTAYYELDDSQGHGVVIVSNDAYLYGGKLVHFKTIYWHLCDPSKEPKFISPVYKAVGKTANSGEGVPVKAGDLIGYGDSTGFSSGDHLHFGLKPIVPGKGVTSGEAPDVGIGNWVNVEQNNGFAGAIDPTQYFPGEALPDGVSVPFAQALKNLLAAGLPPNIYYMAVAVLKKKYKK